MALAFSDIDSTDFYPFTRTRKIEDILMGIFTIRERHEWLDTDGETDPLLLPGIIDPAETKRLANVTDIVKWNDWSIRQDHALVVKNRIPPAISSTNMVINAPQVFIEDGATVEHCILNASEGPIYIAKGALVMEGSMLRGPVAVGEKAVIKMGSKLYGGTTIGTYCTAGGEIKNSILSAYSNKAHDGYLGDSIIGEWCNLGAGTSNSNIKNTAGNINVQLYDKTIAAGIKFGMIMGDYSRAAINTSFNTGTVTGVCCNVFANGLTPKFIPDFSWGCTGAVRYELPRALNDIDNWKKLKGKRISEEERRVLERVYADHK